MGVIGTPQILDDTADIAEDYSRSYARQYLVFATTDASAHDVRVGLGIGINNTHPQDSQALCKHISVKLRSKNKAFYDSINNPGLALTPPPNGTPVYVWTADVEWGPWAPFEHSPSGDPSDTPLRVYFESQTFEEPVDWDINGDPVCNSAYMPYDPPVVRDRTRPILRIVRNEADFSDSTILAYADKVNSDVVGSYQPRTLKCSAPTAVEKFSQVTGMKYFEVTYIWAFNPDTWDKFVPDRGFDQLDPSDSTKRRKIRDEAGEPVSEPAFLNGSGLPLALPITHSNIVIRRHQIYQAISFGGAYGFPTGTFN